MTWHENTSNVPPRCQSLPQRRSKGSAKESGKAWMFLAKKIPERFPNWKFEDVFFGCLILVVFNDFAHLPWGDSPNFQKNAHDSKDFPYINCWFSRFLGYLPESALCFGFFLSLPQNSMATEIQGSVTSPPQMASRWAPPCQPAENANGGSGWWLSFNPFWKIHIRQNGWFSSPNFRGENYQKIFELPPTYRWCYYPVVNGILPPVLMSCGIDL